jgi:uncharacterized protein YjiS (DUF1127 family)
VEVWKALSSCKIHKAALCQPLGFHFVKRNEQEHLFLASARRRGAANTALETVMRYEDARRSRGVESVWLRLKLWFSSTRSHRRSLADLSRLSDHERRDIGLPEPVRYMDWRALKDEGYW